MAAFKIESDTCKWWISCGWRPKPLENTRTTVTGAITAKTSGTGVITHTANTFWLMTAFITVTRIFLFWDRTLTLLKQYLCVCKGESGLSVVLICKATYLASDMFFRIIFILGASICQMAEHLMRPLDDTSLSRMLRCSHQLERTCCSVLSVQSQHTKAQSTGEPACLFSQWDLSQTI